MVFPCFVSTFSIFSIFSIIEFVKSRYLSIFHHRIFHLFHHRICQFHLCHTIPCYFECSIHRCPCPNGWLINRGVCFTPLTMVYQTGPSIFTKRTFLVPSFPSFPSFQTVTEKTQRSPPWHPQVRLPCRWCKNGFRSTRCLGDANAKFQGQP